MKLFGVLALVLLLLAGCGGAAGTPHFENATGWHVLSSKGSLAAANVDFAAHDFASHPDRTVGSLPRSGIVIWAMYLRDRSSHFPPRQLPLRLGEAEQSPPFEGFHCAPIVTTADCYAASGSIRHLVARTGSYAIDLYVFFGTDHPSAGQVAAANAELGRFSP